MAYQPRVSKCVSRSSHEVEKTNIKVETNK